MKYLLTICLFLCTSVLWAQESPEEEADEATENQEIRFVEKELEKNIPKGTYEPDTKFKVPPRKADFQGVATEQTYNDLGVIQRSYMPKSERYQTYLGFVFAPNDVFYNTFGLNGRFNYHINETWGVELSGFWMTSSKSADLENIESKQGVTVKNVSSMRSMLSGHVYFSPIYGKTAWLDDKIIPYEVFASVGFGRLVDQNHRPADALILSVGELFSTTRSDAFRVDLSFAIYQATTVSGQKQSQNSIFLNLGWSHFFPEPSYR